MSAAGDYFTAAGAVVVFLLATEGLARLASGGKTGFVSTVVLGADGRTSTSKTFILMWTLLVAWALTSLLIAGELVPQHSCVAGAEQKAVKLCTATHDDLALLQLGWRHFLHQGLVGSYLVLLGIPASAGLAAKAITQSQAISSPGSKTEAKPTGGKRGVLPRLAEIFSADDGTTDVGDFQYVIFNLITAVYFVSKFVKPVGTGLPSIPDTLLGLTSVSAALYVGKKAVTRNEPKVTSVFPATLREGDTFTVTGVALSDPEEPAASTPGITINGIQAKPVAIDPKVADRLRAVVPLGVIPRGTEKKEVEAKLQVYTAFGATTPEFDVRCVG